MPLLSPSFAPYAPISPFQFCRLVPPFVVRFLCVPHNIITASLVFFRYGIRVETSRCTKRETKGCPVLARRSQLERQRIGTRENGLTPAFNALKQEESR